MTGLFLVVVMTCPTCCTSPLQITSTGTRREFELVGAPARAVAAALAPPLRPFLTPAGAAAAAAAHATAADAGAGAAGDGAEVGSGPDAMEAEAACVGGCAQTAGGSGQQQDGGAVTAPTTAVTDNVTAGAMDADGDVGAADATAGPSSLSPLAQPNDAAGVAGDTAANMPDTNTPQAGAACAVAAPDQASDVDMADGAAEGPARPCTPAGSEPTSTPGSIARAVAADSSQPAAATTFGPTVQPFNMWAKQEEAAAQAAGEAVAEGPPYRLLAADDRATTEFWAGGLRQGGPLHGRQDEGFQWCAGFGVV